MENVRVVGSGTSRVEIRQANFHDLLALHALQRRCFSEQQAYGVPTLLLLHLWPRAYIFTAWSGDRLAGSVVGDLHEGQGRILNLCVDPAFRRRGIAKLLLETVENVLGADDVTLMVEDKNTAAQELYRSTGYLPVADLRNYYGKNRHGILMQKRR